MDQSIKDLLNDIKKIEHGFKHIISAGNNILLDQKIDHFNLSITLLDDESYQSRMLAVYLLGQLSTVNPDALYILENKVAEDENWRVQEMLAKAFDYYCLKTGYESSLPKIRQWISDQNPNVKRAVTEGLRIWTSRSYFKENPQVAIELISRNHSDESEYLRKSVGNALHDIRKKFPELVKSEIELWDLSNKYARYTQKIVLN